MMLSYLTTLASNAAMFLALSGDDCTKSRPLGLKPWYAYLKFDGNCDVVGNLQSEPNMLWLVGAAIFEDLLRIAALVAVGFVIAGGYKMMISQGEPQNFASGRKTVINALIGMVVAIIASQAVAFLAGRFAP